MTFTLDLPEDVARRLAEHVADRDREGFLVRAVERALPPMTDEELERISAEVEADARLSGEMADFNVCIDDGLGTHF